MNGGLELRSVDPARRFLPDEGKDGYIQGFNVNATLQLTDPKVREELEKGFYGREPFSFVIKPYQRGFRWKEDNVRKLLDDIKDNYATNEKNGFRGYYIDTGITETPSFDNNGIVDSDFYCLQTLTVSRMIDNTNEWEVLDGQQRLTATFLIYSILDLFQADVKFETPYRLKYEKNNTVPFILSEVLHKALKDYYYQLPNDQKPRKVLDNYINRRIDESEKSSFVDSFKTSVFNYLDINRPDEIGSYIIDLYYIKGAITTIINYCFSQTRIKDVEAIFNIVARRMYFLWYDVTQQIKEQNKTSEQIFAQINDGKIPLTNAELIKSMVLFEDSSCIKSDTLLDYSRRWEALEQGLSEQELWAFVAEKGDETSDSATRIDFLLEVFALQRGKTGNASGGDTEYVLYDWFREYFKKINDRSVFAKNTIEGIENIFSRIQEWYEDTKIYHFVGLLSILQKMDLYELNVSREEMIKELLAEADNIKKNEFEKQLREKIKKAYIDGAKKGTPVQEIVDYINSPTRNDYNIKFAEWFNYNDPKGKKLIEAILWLMNVLEYVYADENGQKLQHRFSFHECFSGKWSLEHIFPQHPEDDDQEYINQLNQYKNAWKKKKQDDYAWDDQQIHTLGNMALICKVDNTSIGNKWFDEKCIIILDLIERGSFIPPSTKNVFLLVYGRINGDNLDAIDYRYWTHKNETAYLAAMKKTIQKL